MLLFIATMFVISAPVLSSVINPCATVKCGTGTQCVDGKCLCGKNMEYRECGSSCPAKCGNSPPEACTDVCVSGCFCKAGFILSKDGSRCVPESECSNSCDMVKCGHGQHCVDGMCLCGENMEHKECGSACPPRCGVKSPGACIALCVDGCFCKEGFILSKDGSRCIPQSECRSSRSTPAQCNLNEEFKECGLTTEPSCDNPKPRSFTLRCIKKNVCQCSEGYLRHSNKSCVLPMECVN
uniref:TIL domain-containing protein n=1 Tax=Plectus sambesii TaxID=2011161 RepID=A0A914W349_9BILA